MITRYVCPVPECGWIHWVPQSKNAADSEVDALAEISATVARIRGYMDVEKVVTAHLETHPVLQWSIELRHANRRIELLETQLTTVAGMGAESAVGAGPEKTTTGLEAMAETVQEAG